MTPNDTFNLDTLTAQQVLDAATHHLFTMPRKSVYGGNCLYRTPDGNRCVVGALICDNEYDPEIDQDGPVDVVAENDRLPERLVPHVGLLKALQRVHDDHVEWGPDRGPVDKASASECIHDVAAQFGLTVPAIAKVEG